MPFYFVFIYFLYAMTPILFTYKTKKKTDFSTQYFELISVFVIVKT